MLDTQQVIRASCQRSFKYFVKHFWDYVPGTQPVLWNWHIDFLAKELQRIAERVFLGLPREEDLIINISPGTTKSTLVSILFPAWIWCRMPSARVLSASHADDLVLDLSNKSRTVLKSEEYTRLFPEIEFRSDQDTKGYFANTLGGDRYTCTVSGKSPMGFHAMFLLVDDPIDPKKAASEAELKTAQEFFDHVLPSRKVNKDVAVTCLVMQRLHEVDPSGHLLKKSQRDGAAKIRHIKLPAEVRKLEDGSWDLERVLPPEVRRHYVEFNRDCDVMPEGLMDPRRLTRRVLKERLTDGVVAYSGQYLQEPNTLGGGMFKEEYFNLRTRAAPYNCRRIRYFDRASTEGGGARTAGVLLARDKENRYYVEHVICGQWEPAQRNAIIKATALRDRTRYGPSFEPVIWIEREGGSSGKDAFQGIARMLSGFPVKEHNITGMGRKEVRAEPWSTQLAAANVWLVDNGESEGIGKADWDISDYIKEHVLFPNGMFLDQVDASSGAFACLVKAPDRIGVRILGTTEKKENGVDLVIVARDDLAKSDIPHDSLLICLNDPSPVGSQDTPTHRIREVIDTLVLQFADVQPEEHQDNWGQAVVPYNETVDKIMIREEHVKKLWAFLYKKRTRNPKIIVITDDDTRKARSVAAALRESIFPTTKKLIPDPDSKDLNKYIVQMTKRGRYLVVT